MPEFTKSQIDRLGGRLAKDGDDSDHQAFFDFREQFRTALSQVENELRRLLPETVVVGRIKTLDSVIAKIRREHTRLTTMQDIAGCRVVFDNLEAQEETTRRVVDAFPGSHAVDLRTSAPSGYRAVHVVVTSSGNLLVEILIRTRIQDQWAQFSEKLSDEHGIEVKYGGGPEKVRLTLLRTSRLGQHIEWFILAAEQSNVHSHALEELAREISTAVSGRNPGIEQTIQSLINQRQSMASALSEVQTMRQGLIEALTELST